MKKVIEILLTILIVLSCTACADSEPKEALNVNDILKISTWLLDEKLEGTGRWGYVDPSTVTYPRKADGDGYWIPDDGVTQVANEDVFVYEPLEIGVPRIMAPMTMYMAREKGDRIGYINLKLDIDFDGIVEISKVDPADSSIRLTHQLSGPIENKDVIEVNAPTSVNICPVGKILESEASDLLVAGDTLVDKEYVIQIKASLLDGTHVATAQIKLTSIPDPEYPWQTVYKGKYGEHHSVNEERTRFCKIELLSINFNEMYIMREAAGMYG